LKRAIRGILIFSSAAMGLYHVPGGEIPLYVTMILLFAGLTTAEAFIPERRLHALLQLAQIGMAYWLVDRFGAALVFLSLSCSLGYLDSVSGVRRASFRALYIGAHLFSMNIAWLGQAAPDPITVLNANLALILTIALLSMLKKSERKHIEHTLDYDELRRQHFELDEARERIASFAARIEEEAQEEERVRIARKLHDDIGHRLIRIKMMMEAALRILPSERERATGMLEQIREQLTASMEEVRLSVKKVSPTSRAEREYALDRLLEETVQEAGIETSFSTQGIPYPLYPSYRIALYQNAREALTNALRHGEPDFIQMTLIYAADSIALNIRNGKTAPADFPSCSDATPIEFRPGMGIQGMKERTRLLGGELAIEPGPPFTVRTQLPIRGKTQEF